MEAIVEFTPVDETGERVMTRLVRQGALETPLLRDIVKYDDGADDPSLPGAVGWGRCLDRRSLCGARHEAGVVRSRAGLAATERAHEWIFDRLARDLID